MTFLNHGAFGATPRRVLAAQDRVRLAMERQPLRFFVEEVGPAIRAAAEELAAFVGADGQDLALVENTTAGVAAVLASAPLVAGDRVLTTDHAYGAVQRALEARRDRHGVVVDLAPVPLPVEDPAQVVDAVRRALTPATRMLVVDHVTSMSGLVMPVEELVRLGREHGVPVLVDGAHAPGMLPLDLPALDATWYVGNCHKWLCSPKGAALLWTNPRDVEAREALLPTVISHFYPDPFPRQFDWVGTRDCSAWLAVPEALAFRRWLGDEGVRAWNIALARAGGAAVREATGGVAAGPESMVGALSTTVLPGFEGADQVLGDRLRSRLWGEHRIEVACFALHGRLCVRLSGQVYNDASAAEHLAEVLPGVLAAL